MATNNEAIFNFLKHRKTADKSREIKNKKNTPKDFNIKNDFNKNKNSDNNTNADDLFLDPSMQQYFTKNMLPINNIKNYSSFMRSIKEDTYKWKLLHKRLLLSSKLESDTDVSLQLKNEAVWLKTNQKNAVILNKSNIHDKSHPSVKNCKENYNVYTLPSRNDIKYRLNNNEFTKPLENII